MVCFCHGALAPLTAALPGLDLSAAVTATAALPGANIAAELAAWLGARGLPAAPWQPDPDWLALELPSMQMNANAVATISALAQLRAQAQAQFGLDLLDPQQASAFAQIVATMNARLAAMAAMDFNPLGWLRLASLNNAIDQVSLAMQAGVMAPSASLMTALTLPGGLPMAQWAGFLAQLKSLAPMIAASGQLDMNLSDTAQLAVAMRALRGLVLPPLAAPGLMANLTAALSAVAQLQTSLGVNPLALGFPAIMAQIQARLSVLLSALSSQFGLDLSAPPGGSLLAALLSMLPALPYVPTSLATGDVVQAAVSANAVAALNWQVPASLPAIQIGLPTCALTGQINAALGVNAVLPTPCAAGCDAAKIMQALPSLG